MDIAPRFDYGRKPHETHLTEHGAVFATDDLTLTLHAVRDPVTSGWRRCERTTAATSTSTSS